ncbi:hypothetical protein BT96DRAFT_797233, partial [Gymnopus androsaceus JB14]
APAQEAVKHEVKTFIDASKHKTKYQGLTEEVDQAWVDLYQKTLLQIPKSEAAKLPNQTYPIVDDPDGYYIAGLDVFHQLHCLNAVCKVLNKDHYNYTSGLNDIHVYHCVDSICQSLMCGADIAVNVWQWDYKVGHVIGRGTIAHSCRNFEKIREWL